MTGGYSETNNRIEVKSKEDGNDGMYGIFDKVSLGNAEGKIGIGNEKISLSLKGVADGLSGTEQAGLQCAPGLGVVVRAKASVLSGRATVELNIYGWEIETGVSEDILSIGAEAVAGYFPDQGIKAVAHVSPGLYGGGIVFRVKPAQ